MYKPLVWEFSRLQFEDVYEDDDGKVWLACVMRCDMCAARAGVASDDDALEAQAARARDERRRARVRVYVVLCCARVVYVCGIYCSRLVALTRHDSWDDPRMPTLDGLRRRGFTPTSINQLCEDIGSKLARAVACISRTRLSGVTRGIQRIPFKRLEYTLRQVERVCVVVCADKRCHALCVRDLV
jgi:hypothetical protein